MTKEYLKMADVFRGCEVSTRLKLSADFKNGAVLILHGCQAEHAAHAISSHDELVAEVERLRGAVKDAFVDGCQVGWDMTGEGYNAEYGGPDDGRLHEEFSAIFDERYTDTMSLA